MTDLQIKKILVPIDFSDASMNALHTATAMAKRHGASVKLLFVHNSYEKFYPQINLINAQDIIQALSTVSKHTKEDDDVPCNFSYMLGNTVNCIIQEAVSEEADIIVMGKNGSSGSKRMFAGTTTYSLLQKCDCPVLVVPPGKVWVNFTNILFPVRPMLSSLEKYVMIKKIVNKNKATVHLLNLRNPFYINELHIISRLMQLLKMRLKEDNIKTSITYYFRDEKFADKVLATAHDEYKPVDLLVITSEDYADENYASFSNYAQQIIHQSNIPLLMIKPEKIISEKEVVLQELERHVSYN